MSRRPTSRRSNEAREHIEALFNIFLPKLSELMFFPPGYMSPESLKRVLGAKTRASAAASRSNR